MSDITQIKRAMEGRARDVAEHLLPRGVLDKRVSAAELRAALDYDPSAGIFRWKHRENGYPQWNARFAGKEAGSITTLSWNDRHYITIRIFRRAYMAHCLAWLYITGEWCDRDIDHIDTDGTNNRWNNLRPATKYQNLQNRGKNKNNTSGYKGVWFSKDAGRWCAEISAFGKRHHLGYFETPELAFAAYRKAASEMHGAFSRVA